MKQPNAWDMWQTWCDSVTPSRKQEPATPLELMAQFQYRFFLFMQKEWTNALYELQQPRR